MLQDELSVGWDPISLPRPLSLSMRIYALFLLFTIIMTVTRLVALWIAAPPFCLPRQAKNVDYLQRLRSAHASVKQWIGCILLAWGFVASVDWYQVSSRLLAAKASSTILILWAVRDLSVGPEIAFLTALLLFLAQWHLFNRTSKLSG